MIHTKNYFVLFFIFSLLLPLLAYAQDCSYDPVCAPNSRECGCGGAQTRYTLCDGGCSVWYPCSTTAHEVDCIDGSDDDCDGLVDCDDDDCHSSPLCIDGDGDTFNALDDCRDDDPEIHPGAAELCNLQDDNCDGTIDEGCTCTPEGSTQPCGSEVGHCTVGTQTCLPDGTWGDCTGISPEPERCDLVDNDCDGTTDEGCECIDGETRQCGSDIGACAFGTERCIDGLWGSCIGGADPIDEICGNALDDNCNGEVDDGCLLPVEEPEPAPSPGTPEPVLVEQDDPEPAPAAAPTASTAPAHACIDIDGDGYGEGCGDKGFDCDDQDAAVHPGAPEVCNNRDDDCNNIVDEHVTQACGMSDIGRCRLGTERCRAGEWFGCTAILPSEEVCNNGVDDDCDGDIDEDCETAGLSSDKIALKQFLDLKFKDGDYDIDRYMGMRDKAKQAANIRKSSKIISPGKTRITVEIVPIQKMYNLTVFEYVPKSIAQSASQIIFTTEPEIIQDDPLFAWHFDELSEKADLSYEVAGEFEDAHETTSTITIAEGSAPIERPWFFSLIPLLLIPVLGFIFIFLVDIAHRREKR